MSKHVKAEKHFEYMREKLSKSILIVKFYFRMNCLHIFFSFFFYQDEISSRQKSVNSDRHFTIDRVDFISGRG